MVMHAVVLAEAERRSPPRNAGRGAGTIVPGSGSVTLVAQVVFGITTHQLTFVTPNRALHFGRDPTGFIFSFINYGHSPIVRFAASLQLFD